MTTNSPDTKPRRPVLHFLRTKLDSWLVRHLKAGNRRLLDWAFGQQPLVITAAVFAVMVAGFGASDQIDLRDVAFVIATTKKGQQSDLSFTEAASNLSGTLTVNDGTHTANIQLLGQYTAGQFTLASDGHGGTLVSDPPAVAMTEHNPGTVVTPQHA